MRTLHKIDEELKKQKKTQKELCDFIGVKKSVYSDWNSGKNQSYRKHINKIAQFLNVSTDYLLGNSEISNIRESDLSLTDHEKMLIIAYRKNIDMQKSVDKLLGVDAGSYTTQKAARDGNNEVITMSSGEIEERKKSPDVEDI